MLSPHSVQSIRGWVPLVSGLFNVESHSEFSPFSIQSILSSVHFEFSPF
jgi:hypothetical protein